LSEYILVVPVVMSDHTSIQGSLNQTATKQTMIDQTELWPNWPEYIHVQGISDHLSTLSWTCTRQTPIWDNPKYSSPDFCPPLAKGAVLFPVTAGINHPLANSWEDKDLPDRLCTDKANPCPKHKMATSKYSFQGLQLVLIVSPAQTHLKKIVIQRVW